MAHKLFQQPCAHHSTYWAGKTVGILGGSFNPVHEGHIHISKQALANLPIDALWWMFTPGNPFKKHIHVNSVEERITEAQKIVKHPKIIFSALESELGINRTYQLCRALPFYFPRTRFIWVGGMDLPEEFHHWDNAHEVMHSLPIVFFKRPPYKGTLKRIPLRNMRTIEHVYRLPRAPSDYTPGKVFWALQGPTRKISSTEIRNSQRS